VPASSSVSRGARARWPELSSWLEAVYASGCGSHGRTGRILAPSGGQRASWAPQRPNQCPVMALTFRSLQRGDASAVRGEPDVRLPRPTPPVPGPICPRTEPPLSNRFREHDVRAMRDGARVARQKPAASGFEINAYSEISNFGGDQSQTENAKESGFATRPIATRAGGHRRQGA
jgi:hypothetical protein